MGSDSFLRRSLTATCALICLGLLGCAAGRGSPASKGYELVYHRAGELKTSYSPGSGGRRGSYGTSSVGGLSIFTRDGLVYFSERSIVTIYKPADGIFVRVGVSYARVRDNPDATRDVNFTQPPGPAQPMPVVMGIRNADLIRIWDEAPINPERWIASFSQETEQRVSKSWLAQSTNAGQYKGESFYVTGIPVPDAALRDVSVFTWSERYLRQADAAVAVPTLMASRAYSAGADARAAQRQEQAEARSKSAEAQRQATAQQAADSFTRAVSKVKQTGMTVCSSDNRVAFIDEVAGARIKVAIRGHAIGRTGEFGRLGPHDLTAPPTFFSPDAAERRPIEDPNFLFLPLQGPVQFSREPDTIWDEGRYWGVCDYR